MYRFDHCYFFIIVISTYSEITLGTDYTNIRRTIAITKCSTFEFHFEWLFVVGKKFFFLLWQFLYIFYCVRPFVCISYDDQEAMMFHTCHQNLRWCKQENTILIHSNRTHTHTDCTHKHQTTAKLPKYTEWFIKLSYYQWVFHRFHKCYIDI